MKNLLQIIKAVVNESGFGYNPTAVAASDDPLMVQLFALANRVGYDLSQECGASSGWPQLRKEFTFNTVASQEAYAFPSDFSFIINQTEWDRGQKWPLRGPATPQEWQTIKSGLTPITPRRWFRIMRDPTTTANKIYLCPTPTDVSTIVFEYYTNQWCATSGGTLQTEFIGDSDVPILDDSLFILGIKWMFLAAKGSAYAEEKKAYEDLKQKLMARAGAARELSLIGRNTGSTLIGWNNIPDTGYGS